MAQEECVFGNPYSSYLSGILHAHIFSHRTFLGNIVASYMFWVHLGMRPNILLQRNWPAKTVVLEKIAGWLAQGWTCLCYLWKQRSPQGTGTSIIGKGYCAPGKQETGVTAQMLFALKYYVAFLLPTSHLSQIFVFRNDDDSKAPAAVCLLLQQYVSCFGRQRHSRAFCSRLQKFDSCKIRENAEESQLWKLSSTVA